jgi:hypothetical protein
MNHWMTGVAVGLGLGGLGLIAFGAILAGYRRRDEFKATYLTGFMLVILSSMLYVYACERPVLASRDLKVALGPQPVVPSDIQSPILPTRESIAILALPEPHVLDRWTIETIRKASGLRNDFVQYFRSLDYIPTSMAMTGVFRPGNVISYANGVPQVWAFAKELAPVLNVMSAPMALPDLTVSEKAINPAEQKDQLGTLVLCSKASAETASISSLQSAMALQKQLFAQSPRGLYVVVESVICNDLTLIAAAGSTNVRKKSSKSVAYKLQAPVVLAYRIFPLLTATLPPSD